MGRRLEDLQPGDLITPVPLVRETDQPIKKPDGALQWVLRQLRRIWRTRIAVRFRLTVDLHDKDDDPEGER